jgi:hypothetical protein
MAHHKDQQAAAAHVGSGAGKNDEPIGYCMLSLNEMVRGSSSWMRVALNAHNGETA